MKKRELPIKKTKQTETKVWLEHLSIVHEWVRVDVIIDYKDMNVSLVDIYRNKKEYIFIKRWLAYKNWWNNILEAISKGMELGFSKLAERQEIYDKETLEIEQGFMI